MTKCWVESPVFSSRSLVVIYFMYSGVYMSIPNSYKFQSWTLANSPDNRGHMGFLKACLGVECIGRRRGSLRAGKGHGGIYWPVGLVRLPRSWPPGWAIRWLPVRNEQWGKLSDLLQREGLWSQLGAALWADSLWALVTWAAENQLPHSVPRARMHLRGDVEAWDFRLSTEQLRRLFTSPSDMDLLFLLLPQSTICTLSSTSESAPGEPNLSTLWTFWVQLKKQLWFSDKEQKCLGLTYGYQRG